MTTPDPLALARESNLMNLTAKLTFLLRTNLQRLDDETLEQLDAVESELALLRPSASFSDAGGKDE